MTKEFMTDIIIITVAPGDFIEYADSELRTLFLVTTYSINYGVISFFATKYDLNRYLSKKKKC